MPNTSKAAANPTRTSGGKVRRKSRWFNRIVAIVVTLMILGVVTLIVLVQGSVSGEEFSPVAFQRRKFEFYELPLVGLQLSPIRRSVIGSNIERYLRAGSVTTVPAKDVPDEQWHLIRLRRGVSNTPADAAFLFDPLIGEDATFGNARSPLTDWEQWSKNHPAAAKHLWPRVQTLARRELYVFIPQLLQLAIDNADQPDFNARIDEHLRAEYASLAEDLRAGKKPELADQLIRESKQLVAPPPTTKSPPTTNPPATSKPTKP